MKKQVTVAKSSPKARTAPKLVAKDLQPRRPSALRGGEGSTTTRAWDLQTTRRN